MDSFISLIKEKYNFIRYNIFDYNYLFCTTVFCKGFFLSLVSFLKWVLALVITIILVPKLEPYVRNTFKMNLFQDLALVSLYILSLFLLILTGKSLGRLFSYTGLGSVDKVFGFFFGIFKGYVFIVCIFSIVNWFYSYEKWDMSLRNSYFFQ